MGTLSEEVLKKIDGLLPDAAPAAWTLPITQAYMDSLIYGDGFIVMLPDGTAERIIPTEVYIFFDEDIATIKGRVGTYNIKKHKGIYYLFPQEKIIDEEGNII